MARVVFYMRSILLLTALGASLVFTNTQANAIENNFSLQVSPSPLVATATPGQTKTLELKIRNASTADEQLKIEARSFSFDNKKGTVSLDDTLAPALSGWLTLPQPGFTVKSGQWQTQRITISVPKEAGFSYSFALIISRNNEQAIVNNGRLLKGSVAVFTLINIDKPGATRTLELDSLQTDQSVYEFLPATISMKLKNSGNSIVQPYGNIFIQRPGNSDKPLATLPVNESQAYILPGTERTLSATWSQGFPLYQQSTDTSGTSKTTLDWNIEQIRHFRFGQYSAQVVAVYNDGTRDVPIVGEVTFWVIPWKTMLISLAAIIGVVLLFRAYIKKRTEKAVQKALQKQKEQAE